MTHIDHLRVSGFKAVDQMEVDAKGINLITGRNNMGKTSLLQSTDLVFNPENISQFSNDLDKVINDDNKTASIEARYFKEQQTLDSYFNDSDFNGQNRELGLRRPYDDEAVMCFSNVCKEILDVNEDYPIRFGKPIIEVLELPEAMSLKEVIQNSLHDSISEISEKRIVSKMKDDLIILEIQGNSYPYIHLGDSFNDLRREIVERSIDKLYDEINLEEVESDIDEKQYRQKLHHSFNSMLAPRFGGDRFMEEVPPEIPGVNFISTPKADPDDLDLDQENAAVRISDIEEYLTNNGIVENLKDFSFDRLVFKEDDEKDEVPYSFMGSGFKTIVGILWELFDYEKQGDVLLLEEPDVHMHPGYIEELIRQLIHISRKKNIQLFITTHNVDMIEGFFSPSLRREYGDFLIGEFQLIQMSDKITKTLDYEQASEEVNVVNSDLRGI